MPTLTSPTLSHQTPSDCHADGLTSRSQVLTSRGVPHLFYRTALMTEGQFHQAAGDSPSGRRLVIAGMIFSFRPRLSSVAISSFTDIDVISSQRH
jgi:hypothetical protein